MTVRNLERPLVMRPEDWERAQFIYDQLRVSRPVELEVDVDVAAEIEMSPEDLGRVLSSEVPELG